MGGCKADAAGTADKVKQGAFKLGAALAHLEEYDAATNPAGHALAEAQGNRYAAAVALLLAPILAEQARQGAAIELLQSAERDGSAALAREDVLVESYTDPKRGCVMLCKACGATPHRFRPSPEAGPFWRCSECGKPNEGIASGDCFRWVSGAIAGEIGEVTELLVDGGDAPSHWLQTGLDRTWFYDTVLLDPRLFAREPNVPAVPADDEAVNERLAVAADFDLDGPAGERLASAPTPEAIPAAVAQERLAAHFASVGSSVSRADLDGLLDDVAKLMAIRQGHEHDTTTEVYDIYNAIDALALRAGQLRPSRLTGGQ